MKKYFLSLAILIVALSSFAVYGVWLTSYHPLRHWGGMMTHGMMENMMGQGTAALPFSFYFYGWIVPIILIALVGAGLISILYFMLFPEIKRQATQISNHQTANLKVEEQPPSELTSVIKALKPDERKVVEILQKHEGIYLQKDIAKEGEFTRLKTHRIIARLAERNIISVKEHGRTNEITISSWLQPKT